MRNERNSLRQAAITAGILAALGVCTLGGASRGYGRQSLLTIQRKPKLKQQLRRVSKLQQTKLRMMAWILPWKA